MCFYLQSREFQRSTESLVDSLAMCVIQKYI